MDHVRKDTESLRVLADHESSLSRDTEKSSRLSMLFDFDQQLFSSQPYKAMIRKTVKLSIRSPVKDGPGPDEVLTTISSDAANSVSPPVERVRKQETRVSDSSQKSTKIIMLGASKGVFHGDFYGYRLTVSRARRSRKNYIHQADAMDVWNRLSQG